MTTKTTKIDDVECYRSSKQDKISPFMKSMGVIKIINHNGNIECGRTKHKGQVFILDRI